MEGGAPGYFVLDVLLPGWGSDLDDGNASGGDRTGGSGGDRGGGRK